MKKYIILILCVLLISCTKIEKQQKVSPIASDYEHIVDTNFTGVKLLKENAYPGHTLMIVPRGGWILIDLFGTIIKEGKGRVPVISMNNYIIEYVCKKNATCNLTKYDWQLRKLWAKEIPHIHHELYEDTDNSLYALSRETKIYNGRKVDFDVIFHLDEEGNTLSNWSTFEHLSEIKEYHNDTKLDLPEDVKLNFSNYDYYHINSFQTLPQTNHTDSAFQKGNWLLSLHTVNLVMILDKDSRDIVWTWGSGNLSGQHTPRMLKNGNILIFDNGLETETERRGYSRVVELNPKTKRIVWEYKGNPPESFFTNVIGSSQRLPNGNTLVSAGTMGRVFEVTKQGELVWEWYSPIRDMNNSKNGKGRLIKNNTDVEKGYLANATIRTPIYRAVRQINNKIALK